MCPDEGVFGVFSLFSVYGLNILETLWRVHPDICKISLERKGKERKGKELYLSV